MKLRPKNKVPAIRHSMRQSFKDCPRKLFWGYVAGVEPAREKHYLSIGKAYHKGIELWRRGIPLNKAIHDTIHGDGKEWEGLLVGLSKNKEYTPQNITDECSRVVAYIQNYPIAYPEDQDLNWGEPELKIVTRGDQEQGTIDSHFTDHLGYVWIVDDKTRTQLTPHLDRVVQMDEQLLNYASLLVLMGKRVKGAYIREIKKAGIKRTEKEDATAYGERVSKLYFNEANLLYVDHQVIFAEQQLWTFRHHKNQLNSVMRDMMGYNHDFDAWPWDGSQCHNKFGSCQYLELCANRVDTHRNFQPTDGKALDDGKTRKSIWGSSAPRVRTTQDASELSSPPV